MRRRFLILLSLSLSGCGFAVTVDVGTSSRVTPISSGHVRTGCHVRGSGIYVEPDRRCTPGMWISDPGIKKTPAASEFDPNVSLGHVCSKGYNPRPGTSVSGPLKDEADREYGLPTSANSSVEADHYYPRWLGGATNIENFWPERNYARPRGFDRNPKDKLEFAIYRLTCEDRRMTIDQARAIFAGSWVAAYRRYG
jgi:hypothetical protein